MKDLSHFKGFHVVFRLLFRLFLPWYIGAISIYPFVFYKNEYTKDSWITNNHESIHIMQQMECGLVGIGIYLLLGLLSGYWLVTLPALFLFYILYLFFFLINLFKYKKWNSSYEKVPFEIEAYNNANRATYLGLRRPFEWRKYCSQSVH